MGRSDAVKKDMFDGILESARVANERNEFPQLSEYPERLQKTLALFHKIFSIPVTIIPSKRRTSQYKEWILQLDKLNNICPSEKLMEQSMKIGFNNYIKNGRKFFITRPSSINNLLIDAMERIEQEHKDKEPTVQKVSIEDTKKTAKNLKSLFEE